MALARIRNKSILSLENSSLILIYPAPFEMSTALMQLRDVKLLNTQNKIARKTQLPYRNCLSVKFTSQR